MSITLTTLKDPLELDIHVDVHDYEQSWVTLCDDGGEHIIMTRNQLQQLLTFAVKEGWVKAV